MTEESELAAFWGVETSLTGRFWQRHELDSSVVQEIAHRLDLPALLAEILAARLNPDDISDTYLAPKLRDLMPDPSSLMDMDKAVKLIERAINNQDKITVLADYDVDGGTSAAILIRYFRLLGIKLETYVPDRMEEGYGPSPLAFERILANDSHTVITVDCGAAAFEAFEQAHELGITSIVLDHHLMSAGAMPKASALINPNRPDGDTTYGYLAGVGVTFLFLVAFNRYARDKGLFKALGTDEPDLMSLLDLVALGTLCDVAPLTGLNRAFVMSGMHKLGDLASEGLKALAQSAGLERVSQIQHATFALGPRLNASGRIGDPWLATRLLSTDDREEAHFLASELEALNRRRQSMQKEIFDEALADIKSIYGGDSAQYPPVLVAAKKGWHPGVIGIVAGQLKEQLMRPVIIIGWMDDDESPAKGSGRSLEGINLGEAVSAAREEGLLISGGGHAMAAGLSIKSTQIDAFRQFMENRFASKGNEIQLAGRLRIDGILSLSAATKELYRLLERIGPFGQAMPEPVFALENVRSSHTRRVGQDHLKAQLEDAQGNKIEAIAFRCAETPLGGHLEDGAWLHLAGKLSLNEWQGRQTLQFEIIDGMSAS